MKYRVPNTTLRKLLKYLFETTNSMYINLAYAAIHIYANNLLQKIL